jgi:hypothetical protein
MNADNTTPATAEVEAGYARNQIATALATALTHADADTRQRAEQRVRLWQQVVDGMAEGRLSIGSPVPVFGLPSWVTPQVVHGGFATGNAAAGGPFLPHEEELIKRLGLLNNRLAVFAYYLTDAGLAELTAMLDSGEYTVEQPEEAALLTLAWLLRAGDHQAVAVLLNAIAPFAQTLRFAPRPGRTPTGDMSLTWRNTAGDARRDLAAKRPNQRIDTQREVLGVWHPFGDELLAHWLHTVDGIGRVAVRFPDGWVDTGRTLLDRYRQLAVEHTLSAKHRDSRGNFAILRLSLQDMVDGTPLSRRRLGLLQCAVDGMVNRRGRPGSAQLTELRARQAAENARPSHHAIAQVIIRRLDQLPQNEGVRSVGEVTRPVDEADTDIPAGTPVPPSIAATVNRALVAPIQELINRGIVPSAEVLAQFVPQITAATTVTMYPDPALRTLMAATYRAFRNRRSLLLLNLHHQVSIDELPWVQAARSHGTVGDDQHAATRATLTRVADLAIRSFPATILPNPLIRELAALARHAELDLPLVEELAADIFMGTFTQKFANATLIAADLLSGSLYDRYYAIDYPQVAATLRQNGPRKRAGFHAHESTAFAQLCTSRAAIDSSGRSRVAANGMVIEQSQILTTHNLAALVHAMNPVNGDGWLEVASRAYAKMVQLVERLRYRPRPLAGVKNPALTAVKDAAYAWRQMLFFLSLCNPADQREFIEWTVRDARELSDHARQRLEPVVAGLRGVLNGHSVDESDAPGRRFTGWSNRGHWMCQVPAQASS